MQLLKRLSVIVSRKKLHLDRKVEQKMILPEIKKGTQSIKQAGTHTNPHAQPNPN